MSVSRWEGFGGFEGSDTGAYWDKMTGFSLGKRRGERIPRTSCVPKGEEIQRIAFDRLQWDDISEGSGVSRMNFRTSSSVT